MKQTKGEASKVGRLQQLEKRQKDEEEDDVEFVGTVPPMREAVKDGEDDVELISIEIPMKRKEGVDENDDVEFIRVLVHMEGIEVEEGSSSYNVALEEARRCSTSHEPGEIITPRRQRRNLPPPPPQPYENVPFHPPDAHSAS